LDMRPKVCVCFMVLNYVPEPTRRGEMLVKLIGHMLPTASGEQECVCVVHCEGAV
jgi:hypothetical protein